MSVNLLFHLSSRSPQEFLRIHLLPSFSPTSALVLPSLSSPPSLLFNQPCKTDPFCKGHEWFICKICLTNYTLNIHLSVPTAGSREQGLFFYALSFKTLPLPATSQWHRQHHFAAIRRETCQQRMGFQLFLIRKQHWNNYLTLCLQNPKGYLGTPGQMWIVCRHGMDGLGWQTTSDKEICLSRLQNVFHLKQSAQPEFRGWLFIETWHFFFLIFLKMFLTITFET